jgi:hypothetical protein
VIRNITKNPDWVDNQLAIATMPPGGRGTINLQPAGQVQLQATSLQPGSPAVLYLQSQTTQLDHGIVGLNGTITFKAHIPTGARLGKHHLLVAGIGPDGRLTVRRSPANVRRPLPIGDLPVLAAGVACIAGAEVLRRRRHKVPPSASDPDAGDTLIA